MNLSSSTIAVGIDVHKYSHTAVALDFFGQQVDQLTFTNLTQSQFHDWLSKLNSTPDQMIVGIEDINGYGYHVAQSLVSIGLNTRYVPPILTGRERLVSAHKEKTDLLDAKRVAKVILKEFEKTLPADQILLQSVSIRQMDLLLQEKQSLVHNQTGLKNQLHCLLHQHYGDDYQKQFNNCFTRQSIEWYLSDLGNISDPCPASICRRFIQLSLIKTQTTQIDKQLKQISQTHTGVKILASQLLGCGIDTSCRILAEVGNINRFATKAKLARYAGLAPVASSSGNRQRLHTDRGGNRKLNRAIHRIALSQISRFGTTEAKDYHVRKQAEGKSKLWSLRCLKRQISDKIFTLLNSVS